MPAQRAVIAVTRIHVQAVIGADVSFVAPDASSFSPNG
jgi:hypothetical protein